LIDTDKEAWQDFVHPFLYKRLYKPAFLSCILLIIRSWFP
jgi:hypothetical protein